MNLTLLLYVFVGQDSPQTLKCDLHSTTMMVGGGLGSQRKTKCKKYVDSDNMWRQEAAMTINKAVLVGHTMILALIK